MGRIVRRGLALFCSLCAPALLEAAIPVYDNGSGMKFELEIRLQLQYFHFGDEESSENKLYFRRLRPTLEANLAQDWEAEIEFDFGETVEGGAVEFKDLFVSYEGLSGQGINALFGNAKAAFSRQYQSSSKRLTLVERGFVGIDDFGSLDRVVGARFEAASVARKISGAGSFGLAAHEPDASQMEFESPLNVGDDANLGWALSGRFEVAPLGAIDYDQVTFDGRKPRFAVGAAAYRWSNDGSRNPYTNGRLSIGIERADLENARGAELSGAFRGLGLSIDSELQWIHGETVDTRFTGGIYDRGVASLEKLSLVSGYMLLPDELELVGGFDRMDAGTYSTSWKRFVIGATRFWKRNDLKLQFNYVLHRNFLGVLNHNPQSLVFQFQLLL